MLWHTRIRQAIPVIIPNTCCICGSTWTSNQPAQNFNTYVYEDNLDSGACLNCGNASRHRLMHKLEQSGVFNYINKNILFFSPHSEYEHRLVSTLSTSNEVTISDPEDPSTNNWNIEELPCQSECFDVIFCMHVLEHVDNDFLALAELRRVMKPHAVMMIGVPHGPQEKTLCVPEYNTPELRRQYYYYHDHKRLYGKHFVQDYLKWFDVATLSGESDQDFAKAQRIPWTEAIHLARKR